MKAGEKKKVSLQPLSLLFNPLVSLSALTIICLAAHSLHDEDIFFFFTPLHSSAFLSPSIHSHVDQCFPGNGGYA